LASFLSRNSPTDFTDEAGLLNKTWHWPKHGGNKLQHFK